MWDDVLKFFGLVLGYVLTTGVVVAAIAWLVRSAIQHWLSKSLDKYKGDLQREADQFRHELQQQAKEHEIRFRRVDEKVADALCEAHRALSEFIESATDRMFRLARLPPNESISSDEFGKHLAEYLACQRRIRAVRPYIPASFLENIDNCIDRAHVPFATGVATLAQIADNPELVESWHNLKAELPKTVGELLKLNKEIEAEIRKRLGIQD